MADFSPTPVVMLSPVLHTNDDNMQPPKPKQVFFSSAKKLRECRGNSAEEFDYDGR